MSGICGIIHFDEAPVDSELIRKMTAAAAYHGPDGIHYWVEGNVGFAHLALHTTPEAVRERQPMRNDRGNLVLSADARVDNREDLIRTLTSKGYLQDKAPTDADLILAAYECWGEDCPKYIVGDFAFAVWDRQERRLFLAKDPIGIRPLFYARRGNTFYFASSLASVVAAFEVEPAFNEPLLVDFLCWRFGRWVHETIYEGIFRVPASHSLTTTGEGERFTRYWLLGAQEQPKYKTDAEYVERFLELFKQAVRSQMRSINGVGVSVSGGLDSSSIACVAHQIMQTEAVEDCSKVRLYSLVFKDFPHADEREYLEAVLQKCSGFEASKIVGEEQWGFKETGRVNGFRFDEPEIFAGRSMVTSLIREAKQYGQRVILSGEGGDQLMVRNAYWNPELLRDVRLSKLGREFPFFWSRRRSSIIKLLTLDRLVKGIKAPLRLITPESILQRRRHLARIKAAPAWVNKSRIKAMETCELDFVGGQENNLPNQTSAKTFQQLMDGWYVALLHNICSVSSLVNSEYRFPFMDRRLVDFVLMSPPQLRFKNGLTKIFLRKSMLGIMPEQVCQRNSYAYFDESINYGLHQKEAKKGKALIKKITLDQKEYINAEEWVSVWKDYYNVSDQGMITIRNLLGPVLFQIWLQG